MKENKRNLNKEKITRRDFMKYSAVAGCSAFLASKINNILPLIEKAKTGSLTSAEEYELSKAGNIIYSTCLQCHTDCPIKGRILNGVLAKIDGPAYSPQSMLPHIEYLTSPFQAAKSDGKICPKGQAGIQSLYDPYRIVRVLKRVGPRGSNKWEEITFEQAINEVVNGGYLFKKVRGEEKRYVPGLKDIFAVKDPSLMKALKEDAEKVAKGKMTLSEFKRKHNNHLDKLIDLNHPDAGPKNNQFVF
ncbi:MAG: twin-arginine translocation signal domain-containing protein, partial [Methanosarcinales archaeon]